MFRSSCCEVCDRSPYCGVDCGSCHEEDERFVLRDRATGEVKGTLVIEYGEPISPNMSEPGPGLPEETKATMREFREWQKKRADEEDSVGDTKEGT